MHDVTNRSYHESNYILAKAALIRRKRELSVALMSGDDTKKLRRMIEKLQADVKAHRKRMELPGKISSFELLRYSEMLFEFTVAPHSL